jgi:hypothetical protein
VILLPAPREETRADERAFEMVGPKIDKDKGDGKTDKEDPGTPQSRGYVARSV